MTSFVFVPLLIKKDVLSYRLNGCHIKKRHHTQSAPLQLASVYRVFSEGNVPDTVFNWDGSVPNDGCLAGRRERLCLCLFLRR